MSARSATKAQGTDPIKLQASSRRKAPTLTVVPQATSNGARQLIDTSAQSAPPAAAMVVPRRSTAPQVLRRRQIAADVAATAAGLAVACALVNIPADDFAVGSTIWLVVTAGLAWMCCLGMNRLYMARAVQRAGEEIKRIGASGLAATGLTLLISSIAGVGAPERWYALSFVTTAAALVVERLIARSAFNRMRAAGSLRRRVAIIGTDRNAQELYRTVAKQPQLGYEIAGYISANDRERHQVGQGRVIGRLSDVVDTLHATGCVGVLVSLNSVNAVEVNRLSRQLTDAGFHVALSTSLRDFDVTRLRPQAIGEQTLVYLEPTIRGGWRSRAKRVFDVMLAIVGLTIGAPIMAVAAIAIRLDSPGPVLFRQRRVGRDGAEFEMIKLRTMTVDAEQRLADIAALNESDGPLFKVAADPRITRVGRILRRTSIDELPQFWNILRGEMSVVGPRPALPKEVAEWDDQLRERLRVLPGLTGIWQVSGRSSTTFAEYKRLDLYYVDNWSLVHDVRIVLKTVAVVALQRGAS